METDPRIPAPVFFQHTLEGHTLSPIVTNLHLYMDRTRVAPGYPNPGLSKPAIARSAFISWAFVGENDPGDWTFRLRKNEGIIDVATIVLPAMEPGVFSKVAADWSLQVSFAAGETYHCLADGPSKRAVILRAILRFEEC